MLGQYGFLAKVELDSHLCLIFFFLVDFGIRKQVFLSEKMQVFSTFEDLGISVDCVATSEVSISLTLDPSKLWSRELIQQASVYIASMLLLYPTNQMH